MADSVSQDRILGWVREGLRSEPAPNMSPTADQVETNLVKILQTNPLAMQALNRFSDQVEVEDRNKYEFVIQRLPEIITFEEFSLAEYTLHRPDGRTPGIRLWLTSAGFQRILQVLYFPDVLMWRVDKDGHRVREMILEINVSSKHPVITEEFSINHTASDWREELVRTLSIAAVRDSN